MFYILYNQNTIVTNNTRFKDYVAIFSCSLVLVHASLMMEALLLKRVWGT